jgi:hypothetical protein
MFRARKFIVVTLVRTSVRVNDTHYQGTRFSKSYTVAIAVQGFGFACKKIRRDDNSSIASYARHLSCLHFLISVALVVI